jgi:hypothetical protein
MHKGKTTMVGCIAAEAPWLKQRTMDPFQLGMTNSRNPGWGFWQFPHGCSIYWRKTLENYLDATHVSYLVVCFGSRGFKYLRIYVHMSLPSSQMVFPCISIFPDSTVIFFLRIPWQSLVTNHFMHWQQRLCTTGCPNYQHCSGEWGPREALSTWALNVFWRQELDPSLLIARLKKEVSDLKQEVQVLECLTTIQTYSDFIMNNTGIDTKSISLAGQGGSNEQGRRGTWGTSVNVWFIEKNQSNYWKLYIRT